MDRLTVHQYISMTPPLNVIPPWIINNTVTRLIDPYLYTESPERKIECYDFDPYCFPPHIDGFHGHLAYGRLGLTKLKLTLTKTRNEEEIIQTLNTLNHLLHDPEKAAEAMRLNLTFQLRRLLEHNSWCVRQRSGYALQVLSGHQNGRLRVVNDVRLMEKVIHCTKDPSASVRRTIYDLILRLTTYYFAVEKLEEYGLIKLIMEILIETFLGKESILEEESTRTSALAELEEEEEFGYFKSTNEPSMNHSIEELEEVREEELEDENETNENGYDEEKSEHFEECPIDDKNVHIQATLMEALVNLMSFSSEATLDAICYDVLKLKEFFSHKDQTIRILTWNIFKQIFTTEVGQMSMVPHNVLEDMMKAFSNDLSPKELEEVNGTLMLALVKIENRIAALEWGLERVLCLAKQPNLLPGKRLAALNVLSHLAELPEVRTMLQHHLFDVTLSIQMGCPELKHHVETLVERVLWKP